MMNRFITILSLLLLFFAANVSAETMPEFLKKGLGGSIQLDKNQTEDQRLLSPVQGLSEAIYGCDLSQKMRIWPFFDSETTVKCLDNNNIFNNGIANIISSSIFTILIVFLAILAVNSGWISFMRLIQAATGQQSKSEMTAVYALFIFVLLILYPVIRTSPETSNEGFNQNKINVLTFVLAPAFLATFNAYENFATKANQKAEMVYPPIKIPENKNGKVQEVSNIVDFLNCTSEYPSDSSKVDFFSVDNVVTGYKQIGKCSLSISFTVNQELIDTAEAQGWIDYKSFAVNNVKEALAAAFEDASAVAYNVSNQPEPLANAQLSAFNPARLVDGNEGSYELAGMSKAGIGDYVWQSSQNIARRLGERLNRYPGVDETTMPTNRAPQLCVNTAGGTSFFKNADATQSMKACVQAMCVESSSPYVCGAAIAYAGQYVNQNFFEHPNYFTMFKDFAMRYLTTDAFIKKAELTYNSLKIESSIGEALYEPLRIGKPEFSIAYKSVKTNINHDWQFSNGFDLYQSTILEKDWNKALDDALTIGPDGFMGLERTKFCLSNPNTNNSQNSGFFCPSIFKTFQLQGKRFMLAGAYLTAGARASKLTRKTPADRAVESASVKQSQGMIKSVAMKLYDVAPTLALIFMNESTDDMYSEYGATLGNEQNYALAALYAVPELADTMQSIGSYLYSGGLFLVLVMPLLIAIGNLGMFIAFVIVLVTASIKIMPYVTMLIKNEGVNQHSDFFKPFDDLSIFIYSILGYGILFYITPSFVETLFAYGVFDLTKMMTLNHQLPVFESLDGAAKATAVYVIFVFILMIHIFALYKMSTCSFTIIKTIQLGGANKSSTYYEDTELQSKKDFI